jgi:hypothetical protein
MNAREQNPNATRSTEKGPSRNKEKFLESLEKLRRSGLVVGDGTEPGKVEIFIGGVRPPEEQH